ncbi:hypothetical protein [Hymenobacter baengnokdamensis]|uniref:hypothetical protein n=1 Tax=Hymenobacter baengnokdamensis TaxID=2615203 RepID=UPI00124617A6|nr:hypothetical protein [Hymenobacter baengnokdamensis]
MKLLTALLLNGLLLAAAGWWLRREFRAATPRLRRWLLLTLALRLGLTAIAGYWPGPDARGVSYWAQGLTTDFWANPAAAFERWQSLTVHAHGEVMTTHSMSNTLFFSKLLGLLNLASGGALWLNSLYLSVFCYIACWELVRVLSQVFPTTPRGAGLVAWLLWPSVLWWSAGLNKETVLVGASAGLAALVLAGVYGRRPVPGWRLAGSVVLGGLLAWVLFRMRYFFALPLFGGLVALALVQLATGRGWLNSRWPAQAGTVLLLIAAGGGTAMLVGGRYLEPSYFSLEVNKNYQHGLLTSQGRPHLVYADWQPTPLGLLRHAPQAVVQVLVRPWLGESARPLYLLAALENVALVALLLLTFAAGWNGRVGRLPVALVVVLVGYCLLLAAFIGLSTPNLGTLHRYRAVLLPWLLLLLLQNDYARALLSKAGLAE